MAKKNIPEMIRELRPSLAGFGIRKINCVRLSDL